MESQNNRMPVKSMDFLCPLDLIDPKVPHLKIQAMFTSSQYKIK